MDRILALLVRHGFSLGLVIGATGVLLLGMLLLWRTDGPTLPGDLRAHTAPPTGPRRPTAAQGRQDLETRRRAILASLVTDAAAFDVPLAADRFQAPFPVFRNDGRWVLPARGGRLVTRELRLLTEQRSLTTPLGGLGTYKADHLVLTVENRTDQYLAFRVDTTPSGAINCRPKALLPQTTLVLGPREALHRTECLAKGRDKLVIHRIEVMPIPPLSFHYLVKLKPVSVGISARVAEGHRLPAAHRICAGVPRQAIEQALRAGTATWFDVMDFYARYSCDRHEFQVGYRRQGPDPAPSPILRSALTD